MGVFEGTLGFATPTDAPAIAALIERCYGETYVTPGYCDPAVVARAIEDGSLTYAIAKTGRGDLVAQVGLARTGGHGLYEVGRSSIVDVPYRGMGLAKALGRMLVEARAREVGARFLWGRCVTSHLFAQGQARSDGMKPIGLLLGLCPLSFTAQGLSAPSQPVSVLVVAQTLGGDVRPRALSLEGLDLERALATLDVLRLPAAPSSPARASRALGAKVERDPATGLVHVRFSREAPPFAIDSSVPECLEEPSTRLIWADVPVEAAEAPALVEQLRGLGLSFGCYLPLAGPRGEDVLRLQRYLDPAPLELGEIHVVDEARALRDAIFAEALVPAGALA